MAIHRLFSLFLACLVIVVRPTAYCQHEHAAGHVNQLGAVNFANSCSPAVQLQFQRAVAMLHSFWYDEAARQFRTVAEADPKCAIAWWGVAMTEWHPIWEPRGPGKEEMNIGSEAIRKAKTAENTGTVTARERQFIAALDSFYTDYEKTDHVERILAYEKQMRAVHEANPADNEATVFFALSLLGSAASLPPDKSHARQKEAGSLVGSVFQESPTHPGLAHMIIHAYDYPDLADKALPAAQTYAKIAPESPHALHMPSHIFTRLGLWQESIDSNLASAAAARKYHLPGDELHAMDYLVFAYLQTGQDRKAHEVFSGRALAKGSDAAQFAGIFSVATMPARYVLERRQWTEAAALPDPVGLPGGRYAWADASTYYARALGAARSGKIDQARKDVARLEDTQESLKELKEDYWAGQVAIEKTIATAWLTFAEGKHDEALDQMRTAVALDDATDKHPVTPGSIVPPRDLLGQMLIEVNKPADALKEYKALLAREPNRFAALYGLGYSAQLAGQKDQAREAYGKLMQIVKSPERAEVRYAQKFLSSAEKGTAGGR